VKQSSQATAGQTYSFSYTYDLMGSLKNETYPSGRVITTEYDGAERASSVAGDLASLEKNYATQVSYMPHGGIRALPMGNNVWEVYSYNSRLQVQRIEDAVNNDPSQVLFDQHFEWGTSDNNGNLQSVVTNHGGPGYPQFLTFKEYYGYDPLNRVLGSYGKDINENLLWGQNFSYDRYGNAWTPSAGGLPISGLTPTTNVYNTANRMNATTYDAAGNQTVVGAYALVYDAENRQIQSADTTSNTLMQYQYDGDGRRVQKATGSAATVYVYDAFGQLAAEYTNGSAGTPPCTTCFLSTDHLGNTRLVTDGSANVIARHDFTPFGEEIPAGYGGRGSEWGKYDAVNQKFTGQEHDEETQFDFFQARYLSAAQQRFMSPDPGNAGADPTNPQSWNAYAYVNNNPLNATDPTGMCHFDENGNPVDDADSPCVVGGSGGSVDVPGGSPDPAPLDPDPCIYFDCIGGGRRGSDGSGSSQPLQPTDPPTEVAGVPTTTNVVSVYRQQLFTYVKLIGLNKLCPAEGSGPMMLKSLGTGIIRGAAVGAIKGGVQGAAVGTFFDGVGAAPGAVLGAAIGAVNSLATATVRAKTCEALGVNGY
jgi:RHS repeat-associated protein